MVGLFAELRPRRMWGLDSFKGLPDSAEETSGWAAGKWSADPRAIVVEQIKNATALPHLGPGRVQWVKGFYNESLTDSIVTERGMKPARYVDIDWYWRA
eukprot:5896233-Prymnesium_polylepis.1